MSPVPSTLILASAGTGKTYALSSRYIDLLERGVSPSRILATTFTRQAAGEILDRVLLRLLEGRNVGAMRAMLQGIDRVRVSTLDSLFSQIAAGSATDVGLPPGWRIVEEDEDERLRAGAVEIALQDGERDGLLALLRLMMAKRFSSKVASEMLSKVEEAHSVFRGAPEGAWSVIGVPADLRPLTEAERLEILEEWDRVPLATVKDGSRPNANWRKAHTKAAEAIRQGDWEGLVRNGIAGNIVAGAAEFSGNVIEDAVIRAYDPLIRHARWTLLTRHVDGTRALRELLAKFDTAYAGLKERHRAYRFDDVPRALAAESNLSLEEIAFRLDGAIDHVLLDEFQDTSSTQFSLLEPLLAEILAGGGGRDEAPEERSVLCVGDLKQSLYQWRDAEPALFGALAKRWPQMQTVGLHVSYRSSQVVLDAVNRVFTSLVGNAAIADHTAVAQAWEATFVRHESAEALRGVPGFARLTVAPRSDAGVPQKVSTLRAAAEHVAEMVRACPGLSVGILVRWKKAIPRLIFELKRLGVEASEEGGNPLTDSPAVAAALSALQLADHPGDTAAAFHVATSPMSEIVGLTGWSDEGARLHVAAAIRARAIGGFAPLLEYWMDRLSASCDARDIRRFEQLIELAAAFDARRDARAENFVTMVRSKQVEDPASHPVRVLTIHKSKGLEFDAVVLADLDATIGGKSKAILWKRGDPFGPIDLVTRYPNEALRKLDARLKAAYTEYQARVASEELCVLYVAMTRARRCVEIIVSPDKVNAKTMPSTLAGIVRQALTPGASVPVEPGVLATLGDASWMEGLGTPTAASTASKLHVALARGKSPARLGRFRPPSSTGHTAVRRSAGARRATDRGELLHRWAQEIGWLDAEVRPSDDHMLAIARTLTLEPTIDARRELAWFWRSFEVGEMREALSRRRYSEGVVDLRREVPFALALREDATPKVVMGRIDRLVVCRTQDGRLTRAEVLDFKSDKVTGPQDIGRLAEAYRSQMESYILATQRLTGLEAGQVKATLLFLAAGNVVEIAAKT